MQASLAHEISTEDRSHLPGEPVSGKKGFPTWGTFIHVPGFDIKLTQHLYAVEQNTLSFLKGN